MKFNLSQCEEEKLRLILNEFSSLTQTELLDKLDILKELPNHSHVIIRPKKLLRPPTSMLSAASYDENFHQLHLVDYVLIYLNDPNRLIDGLKSFDNNRLDRLVWIGLTDNTTWKTFNFDMIREALK